MEEYLQATPMLNYHEPSVRALCQKNIPLQAQTKGKLQALYTVVSSLKLGYNANDTIPASQVIKDNYGQCNTKVTLLMALARCARIPCRVHCYKISKTAQEGRVPQWMMKFAPETTLFTWPEFFVGGDWVPLQKIVHVEKRAWESCPFDGAAWQLEPLKPEWIVEDQGVWSSQDEYFKKHKPSVHGWRKIGWHIIGRKTMNKRLC